MPYQQIDNPQGAFGYPGAETTGVTLGIADSPGQGQKTIVCRNASTAFPIQPGMTVFWSTVGPGSSNFTAVRTNSSTSGDPQFVGIAKTSAGLNTLNTTVAGTTNLGAAGTDYLTVVVEGPVVALVSSAAVAGDLLWPVNSTGTTASGTTYAGSLGVAPATVNGGPLSLSLAGFAASSGTTGTTGYLTTVGPRALVYLRPQFNSFSS